MPPSYDDVRSDLSNEFDFRDFLARIISGKNPDGTSFVIGSAPTLEPGQSGFASAVAFNPVGTIGATDVQAAIVEVEGDAASALSALAGKANTSHHHGVVDLGTGTPAAGKYLDGDDSWKVLPAPGGSGSGLPSNMRTVTADATAVAGDFMRVDATSGAKIITLPTGAPGDLVIVAKIDSSANAVSADVTGGGTVNGDATGASLASQNSIGLFECTSAGAWQVVSGVPSSAQSGSATQVTVSPAVAGATNAQDALEALQAAIDGVAAAGLPAGAGLAYVQEEQPAEGVFPWVWFKPSTEATTWYAPDAEPTPTAPTFSVNPAITGTALVGSTLTCDGGTATGTTPITKTYQWKRDGTNISGSTASTYVLASGDVGHAITCAVTLANGVSPDATVASNAITPALPANTVAPAITGTAETGQTLTLSNGTWTGSPTFTRKWQRNTVDISGATNTTYVLQVADEGTSVRGVVTGTNANGAVSANSNTVSPTAPSGFDPDTISGIERFVASDLSDGAVASWLSTVSAATLAQGTSANRPVKGTVGSNPAVTFDGINDVLSGVLNLTQPFDVWMVLKFLHVNANPTTGQTEAMWSVTGTYTGGWWAGNPTTGDLKLAMGTDLLASPVALHDNFHTLRCLANGATSKVDVDAANVASGDAGTNDGATFAVGASLSGGFESNFAVAEVIVKKTGAFTSPQLANLATYAQSTYGTP